MDLLKDSELGRFEKKLKAIKTSESKGSAAAIAHLIEDDEEIGKSITVKERSPRGLSLIVKTKSVRAPNI